MIFFLYFKGDYALLWREGDYRLVEIEDIKYTIKNRYYLVPRYYITYCQLDWPGEWVGTLSQV